ncbi:PIN domain-containing protein [Paenibacillus glycanilyticus]|uniref:PIN domain-containing protein n=1 Tax=Paenibacillus glycanilyticus TaxID=126569 RepID=UPI000FDCDD3F|nr:PIN domain-containing protein [Paenibacillus glycanilyticus]
MKNRFPGFYEPETESFDSLWKECTFIFDTNSLLNLYRYQRESRELLLTIIKGIKDRIWLPYQVAMEYHLHLHSQIIDQKSSYTDIKSSIEKRFMDQRKELIDLRHSNIAVDEIIQEIDSSLEKIKQKLSHQENSHPELINIQKELSEIIGDKIGRKYTQEELDILYNLGDERFNKKIPPGFKDRNSKKDQTSYYDGITYKNEFGDFIYWKQILEYSSNDDVKSVILVTDDRKPDWWNIVKGKNLGPLPELIQEFKNNTSGKDFYMYQTNQFLKFAKEHLTIDNPESVEKAIKDISDSNESLASLLDYPIDYVEELYNHFKENDVRKDYEDISLKLNYEKRRILEKRGSENGVFNYFIETKLYPKFFKVNEDIGLETNLRVLFNGFFQIRGVELKRLMVVGIDEVNGIVEISLKSYSKINSETIQEFNDLSEFLNAEILSVEII